MLEKKAIAENLSRAAADSLGHIEIYAEIDSTNSEAMRRLRSGYSGKSLIAAEKQSAGRGRRGRQWHSPGGGNLYFSLLWPFARNFQSLEGLSLAVAVSLLNALLQGQWIKSSAAQLKWPNDLWLNRGKLAGILLELHGDSQGPRHVVIGVGLNVNMPAKFRDGVGNPVADLHSVNNEPLDRNLILATIVERLIQDLDLFAASGFSGFRDEWLAYDMFFDTQVDVVMGGTVLSGIAQGVNHQGALLLRTSSGDTLINCGEVTPTVRASQGLSK